MSHIEHPIRKPPESLRAEAGPASPTQRMQERRLRVGEHVLNCAVGPENGPPLVLLHGVTRCWRDFVPLFPDLIERWQVFAPDHRGHGKSDRSAPHYRVADFATDAVALIEQHLPGPVVLLGHSLGALVAALVAAELPGRVRALILEDPPGSTLAGGIRQSRFHLQFANTERLLATARDAESLTRELAEMEVQRPSDRAVVRFRELRDLAAIRFGAECLLQLDPAVLTTLGQGRWFEGLDWFGSLAKIECPTLLLRADLACGGMLSDVEAARITSLIPRCSRLDLPGIGHAIHSTQPDKMLSLLTDWLESTGIESSSSSSSSSNYQPGSRTRTRTRTRRKQRSGSGHKLPRNSLESNPRPSTSPHP